MPTIALASSKGGAGKSTAAVLLASELARGGATVTIIDADPNQPVARWSRKPGKPDKLSVIGDVTEDTLIDTVEDAARKTAFVIIDLEGTRSVMVGQAISLADFVIIPTRGSHLDVHESVRVIKSIRQYERVVKRPIPFAVLYTQTNPAIRPRTLQDIEAELLEQGVPAFATALHDRDAFRCVWSYGGTVHDLPTETVRNVPKAIENVQGFAREVIRKLKTKETKVKAHA
jgi:chromosome partitioning protein